MVTRTESQDRPPCEPGLHAILLAAGAGTRMGGGKLRRSWRGRPLFTWALEAALATPVKYVWVVTGADDGVQALIPVETRLSCVTAERWAGGLSASLKAGVAALPASAEAALVFLGDMPRIPLDAAPRLIEAWRNGAQAAAPVHRGRRGHPVLLARSLFSAVADLTGDRGAGALLATLGARLTLVDTPDDGVLFDVDTPDMLEA